MKESMQYISSVFFTLLTTSKPPIIELLHGDFRNMFLILVYSFIVEFDVGEDTNMLFCPKRLKETRSMVSMIGLNI